MMDASVNLMLCLLMVMTVTSALDRPNAPLLSSIECKQRTATLHWEPKGDNGSPILRYSIQFDTTFTPGTWDLATEYVPAAETSWNVELSPWANYTFRVVAHNKVGPSAPSGHSDACTTQPDVPYKNPDKVEGRGTEPNNMVISWSVMPQIEHNGPGFHYQVWYKRNVTGETWLVQNVQDWRQTELLVPNTPTFVRYNIKVFAWNSKGASNVAPVEVIGWSGEDKPLLAPTNVTLVEIISGKAAVLSWKPVPPESVRGHFKGYRIQTWTDGEEDQVREVFTMADTTTVLINVLKPYKKNNVRIMVYNGLHNGPPSDTLSFVTPEDKPGPVRSFNAYPLGSTAMLLTWDKPVEENGVLTGYKVYCGKEFGMVRSGADYYLITDSEVHSAKLVRLKPATKYWLKLRAKTKAGEGETFYLERTTPADGGASVPDVPGFEAYVVAAPDTPNKPKTPGVHVLVRWKPAVDGHPGTHFQVSYRLKDHPQWQQWPMEMDNDYVIMEGLEPNKQYQFKVTAYDGDYFTDSEVRAVDTTNDISNIES